mmetsp:Transcript_38559/g.77282  ORF Transcript_38559/g.77282 Transcript_38559/m.77282 type:complete len:241 (+) Transcript_38559:47-769(+)
MLHQPEATPWRQSRRRRLLLEELLLLLRALALHGVELLVCLGGAGLELLLERQRLLGVERPLLPRRPRHLLLLHQRRVLVELGLQHLVERHLGLRGVVLRGLRVVPGLPAELEASHGLLRGRGRRRGGLLRRCNLLLGRGGGLLLLLFRNDAREASLLLLHRGRRGLDSLWRSRCRGFLTLLALLLLSILGSLLQRGRNQGEAHSIDGAGAQCRQREERRENCCTTVHAALGRHCRRTCC